MQGKIFSFTFLFLLSFNTFLYSQDWSERDNYSVLAGIFITKLSDLNFGDVFIGYPAEVRHTDANCAKFRVWHDFKSKDVQISFQLPSTLNYLSNSIPITFGLAYSAWNTIDSQSGRTNFNPFTPVFFSKLRKNDDLYFWLGATINPPLGILPGTYTGTIIITAEVF